MRTASPPRLPISTRTDKETRLRNFITEGLARRAGDPSLADAVTVVVRNPESPVAHALCAALFEGGFDFGVRVVFGETNSDERAALSLLDAGNAEFRVLGDPRFGAAHEQLVVGAHVWTGDCLRRDPNKRDAFEIYHASDPVIRALAATSFEKLWAAARPLKPVKMDAVAAEIIAAGQAEDSATVPGNHRH